VSGAKAAARAGSGERAAEEDVCGLGARERGDPGGIEPKALRPFERRETVRVMHDERLSVARQACGPVLEPLVDWRGAPLAIRLDNGLELLATEFVTWCERRGIQLRLHSARLSASQSMAGPGVVGSIYSPGMPRSNDRKAGKDKVLS
jgi:hypothetical protein